MLHVLIVGAGPTGLVLALELARRGVRARIVDRNSGPGTASRAMAVHARTLEFYDRLGLASDVVERGIKVERAHVRDGSREVARVPLGDIGRGLSPFPFVLSFPQDEHERVLVDHLERAGIEIEWNTELAGFTDHGDHITARLRRRGTEESIEAAWLCGCDGAHSAVREGARLEFAGGTYEQMFYVTDVEATGVGTEGDLNICVGPDLLCVVFPIRTTGHFRLIGILPPVLRGVRDLGIDKVRPYVEGLLGIRIGREHWFSAYNVHHRVAEHFRRGRAFLAGDAGHVHSPAGGQGMNTGIGDAVNLAWKLAEVIRGRAREGILDSYEPERIAFARLLVATTDRAFTGVIGQDLRGRFIRGVVIPHIAPQLFRFEAFRRFTFRTVSQTRLHYRGGDLASGTAGAIHGGDRLPWVESAANFAPLASLEWQIHVHGTTSDALASFAAARGIALHGFAWSEDAARAGYAKDAAYLVRPDAYVAVATATQDPAALGQFLGRVGFTG